MTAFDAPGVRISLDGAATGGTLCLLELVLPPGGGAGHHTHTREDETIAVVRGDLTVLLGAERHVLGAGSAVFIARGVRHAFRAGDEGAAAHVVATPAGLEEFFRALERGEAPEAAGAAAGLVFG